jgi:ABC-type enterochelin transport system permease subunit
VLTCIALAVVAANLFATAVVMRSDFYSPLQRGLQLALVWLVPVAGAACCVSFASIHRREMPGPGKPLPKPDSFDLPGGEGNSL